MSARYIVGDALAVLQGLPAGSVDCAVTSPPYFLLRSYLASGDPAKVLELGQEGSPGEFVEAVLVVMDELWRVLADHGTFWLILGDTHAGSGGAGGDYNAEGLRAGQPGFEGSASKARRGQVAYRNPDVDGGALRDRAVDEALGIRPPRRRSRATLAGWPVDQSVCWVPHLVGASLAYGRNLLTGAEHRQWVTRPPVTWCKLNPVVGRLTRTFRTATELVIYGGKHQAHYFDLDAVRTPSDYDRPNLRGKGSRRPDGTPPGQRPNRSDHTTHPAGSPPLSWWVVNSVPYKAAHFAVFPPGLVVRPIEAGCPRRVCVTCGAPSERITARPAAVGAGTRRSRQPGHERARLSSDVPDRATVVTVGWSTCGCPGTDGLSIDGYHTGTGWRTGVVLDPYAGTGTTLAVATGHGRDALGIDLDPRNADLAQQRVGMFLDTTTAAQAAADIGSPSHATEREQSA